MLVTLLCLTIIRNDAKAQQTTERPYGGSAETVSRPDSSALLARIWPNRKGFRPMPAGRNESTGLITFGVLRAPMTPLPPAVHGTGTIGRISMWVDTSSSGNSVLGDSIITQLSGNIGIGLDTPLSKLTVQGMIETTLGGYKFPDGTVQTTAAVSGLQSVIHDSTLSGDGTAGSPLGVSFPLVLKGASPGCCIEDRVLTLWNTSDGQNGLVVIAGGSATSTRKGGTGIFTLGGISNTDDGGAGVSTTGGGSAGGRGGEGMVAHGGSSDSGDGGAAFSGFGGTSQSGEGGVGIITGGGFSVNGRGGLGMSVGGGGTNNGIPGDGILVSGGSTANGTGGNGILASGGNNTSGGFGGNGIVVHGGNFNGRGLIAFGGTGSVGYGVETTGGPSTGSGSTAGAGIFAKGGPSSGSNSASGFGIFASAGEATNGAMLGRAGSFEGDVSMTSNLTVGGDLDVQGSKHFKIDHPLDPENKYLLHASIESSEVLNVYSGNIVTNSKGEAVVTLPEWFEALNSDLRYQLTVIGTFAQAIVAEKVKQNRFTIKTSEPNVEVSWQVTGVRSDATMRKHPFKAETSKPERERGSYLAPELFGKPEERGIEWALYPEMMRQLRQQRLEAARTQQQKQLSRINP
jgi:hypothetical protein